MISLLRPRCQRGVAAVEMAIMLPLLLVLLTAPLYIGRILWHYTAAQKAAHDAARYVSMVSESEMRSPASISAALTVARDLIKEELSDLNTGGYDPVVDVLCDGLSCAGIGVPVTVRVVVRIWIKDPFFGLDYGGGDDGIALVADVQMRYAGNK